MADVEIQAGGAVPPPRNRLFHRVAKAARSTGPRTILPIIIFIIGACLLAFVAASPLILGHLGVLGNPNWKRLSFIGQTYGAASALLTGLALIGVTGSIIFQVRAIQAAREQSSREHHLHLIEMALNDPEYLRCWGDWGADPASYPTPDRWRQHVYINLIISYWERDFVIGARHERTLRPILAELFEGETGRRYWKVVRELRLKYPNSSREQRFYQIVDEEYSKAISTGQPTIFASAPDQVPPVNAPERLFHRTGLKTAGTLLVGTIGGELLRLVIRQLHDYG